MMSSKFILAAVCSSTPFLFTAEWHSIVQIQHILFIWFSVDGHLGSFHLLTLMNNAVMNIHVHISGWIYVFNSLKLGVELLRVELLGHMVTMVTFWRTAILFSKVTAPFFLSVPTSSHLYQCLLLSIFFGYGHPSGCEVVSHCGFFICIS